MAHMHDQGGGVDEVEEGDSGGGGGGFSSASVALSSASSRSLARTTFDCRKCEFEGWTFLPGAGFSGGGGGEFALNRCS